MLILFLIVAGYSLENLTKGDMCVPCKGSQFSKIPQCHQTGYIQSSKGNYTSCTPQDSLGYFFAIKMIIFFGILSAVFIVLANIRRNYLLGSRFS